MQGLRKIREEMRISQAELAQALKVRQTTVSMWESGKNMPRADKLPELARILGCAIGDLYGDGEESA